MNCQKPVTEEQGKVFAEVFVCGDCYTLAERMYQRLELELRQLLVMSKEAIRIALCEGKVTLAAAQEQELSKAELLKTIVQLSEKKKNDRPSLG